MKQEPAEQPETAAGEPAEAAAPTAEEAQPVQTITINGQQYQIVSSSNVGTDGSAVQAITMGNAQSLAASSSSGVVQYAATSQNGQTMFIPGTVAAATAASGSLPGTTGVEDASRKREIRLLKNREAARECRNKKKEYIKCLESRVAILENQNKALIEELKSLKELYASSDKS